MIMPGTLIFPFTIQGGLFDFFFMIYPGTKNIVLYLSHKSLL